MRASAEMKEYFVGILADRRKAPKDDMVSILAGAEINGVKMSDEQIYGFMRNLLPAGAETTSRSTASLAMGLLTHPEQLDAVRERPQPAASGHRGRHSLGDPTAELHAGGHVRYGDRWGATSLRVRR